MSFVRRSFFILLGCSLVQCSAKEDPSGRPPKGDRELTKAEQQQASDLLGAIGDLQFLLHSRGSSLRNLDTEIPKVDRADQRFDLEATLDFERYTVAQEGVFDQGKMQKDWSGGQCPVLLSYQQNRRELIKTSTARVMVMDLEGRYESDDRDVATPIRNMEWSGEYREIFASEDGTEILKKGADLTADGYHWRSRKMSYKMQERWQQTRPQADGEIVTTYLRVDEIQWSTRLRMTLYRAERFVDGQLTDRSLNMNGQIIDGREYGQLLQDLGNQWGHIRYAAD